MLISAKWPKIKKNKGSVLSQTVKDGEEKMISLISPLVGTPQTWFNTLRIALALRITKHIETCP